MEDRNFLKMTTSSDPECFMGNISNFKYFSGLDYNDKA